MSITNGVNAGTKAGAGFGSVERIPPGGSVTNSKPANMQMRESGPDATDRS